MGERLLLAGLTAGVAALVVGAGSFVVQIAWCGLKRASVTTVADWHNPVVVGAAVGAFIAAMVWSAR